ncbi:advanced glycosylation end product-specific receptor [Eucyclogobius newberryi]|uniref:advanced glycosylation end product-specific receptor n=1 Tax=Eucyclogobius newberryi TaxID=166745 RepID=UPI003B5CFECF
MASCGIALASLLIISLMPEAKSEQFLSVKCQKSEMIAQYGTNTLLNCVAHTTSTDYKIVVVSWKLNKTTVLQFHDGEFKIKKPGFQFAVNSWDSSNLNVSLLITNTDLTHAGKYMCNVVANVGAGATNMLLTVKANYSKPKIRSEPEKINPDESFSLTCVAHGGYPKGDIRWVVDGHAWTKNPQVQVTHNPNGLFDLTSTLSFGPDSLFQQFACVVYNAKGLKEDQQEWFQQSAEQSSSKNTTSYSHILAPVVVIGSLIVGLLVAILLLYRRRRQKLTEARRLSAVPLMNATPNEPEEQNALV